MADVAMGNLRFDLTADNSQFMAAVKQAKEAQTQAASEMGSKFAEASQKAQQALQQMAEKVGTKLYETIRKLQELGKAAGEVWAKGAEGAEEATNKAVKSMSDKLSAWLYDFTGKIPMVGGALQKIADLIVLSGAWDQIKGKLLSSAAGWADGMLEKFKAPEWGKSIRDSLVATSSSANSLLGQFFDSGALNEQQKKVDAFADGVQKKMNEMVEGVRNALQKLAGTWDGVGSAVKNAIEALKERTAGEQFQTGLLGKDRGERTEAQERQRVLQDIGKSYEELTTQEKKLFDTELQNRVDAANDFEQRQKELEQTRQREQAVTSLTAALKRQGDMALANAGRGEGKTAFDRAMERSGAMSDAYSRGKIGGLAEDPGILAQRQIEAQKAQDAANLSYRVDQSRMLREANDKGYLEQSTLGARPGETEKLRVEMELMNKARREGVTLDQGDIALNQSVAESMGKIAQATAQARETYADFKQVGLTVASSLESAFSQFISGTQVNWKQFIQGLQADLAKLAFKKGVESLLVGTSATGGGLFGALSNVITGARADGGSVNSGGRYIVGERGPEMFVPQSAGSIVSNQALMGGGAGSASINMTVNLAGANGDETIAKIASHAARTAAAQAFQQMDAAFPARQRRLHTLGA